MSNTTVPISEWCKEIRVALPIDSNLGFAAIVPYNESVWNPKKKDWEKVPKAQFQMMYKGFIQLAIRSGYYERMNYAVVYKDELESYNPITGEIKFVEDFSNCKQRDAGDEANVAGYYAWFRLKTGYSQATDTLQSYLGMMKYCDCDALKEKILDDFVLTHADMKQIYEEGGDRDENYYRRGDGWSVEDYPVTDETHRPAGTCITAAWNY